jgi:hypothetical protein
MRRWKDSCTVNHIDTTYIIWTCYLTRLVYGKALSTLYQPLVSREGKEFCEQHNDSWLPKNDSAPLVQLQS